MKLKTVIGLRFRLIIYSCYAPNEGREEKT